MYRKFSKDPKVKLISIKKFFELTDYISDVKINPWKEGERPNFGSYYKITSKFLILIDYTFKRINFGMDLSEKLNSILVAYRDGKTEYEILDYRMRELFELKEKNKNNVQIDKAIAKLESNIKFLKSIEYSYHTNAESKPFESCIIDTNYKTTVDKFKGQYLVFDVETNGIRRANDDLLSISIYDPESGKCYNRYLPLELQPLVLTTWIHGIKDKDLENVTHITQEELDKVIDFFDLKNKTLLSFSGGQGTFDSSFIINYCKRHNLVGFENLHYENIKSMVPDAGWGTEGQMSKDNLCRLLKIEGVQKVHSGINDCVIEWKLFERIQTEPLFFIDQHMFKYHEGYIVPVSYLNSHPELIAFANINVPYIVGHAKLLYEFSFPKKVLKEVKKFPTNITGITLENGINSFLKVVLQDNFEFLAKNKNYLEYIGSLDCRFTEIHVETQKDGTIKSLNHQYDVYINEVNAVTKLVTDCLTPVFDFIRKEIFTGDVIMSQELSISKDGKVLALCDLSDKDNVLEIKTHKVAEEDGAISDSLARQLYYESNGRKTFVLSLVFDSHFNSKGISIIDAVNVRIYKIKIEESVPKPIEKVRVLSENEFKILRIINDNPSITNAEIARVICINPNKVGKIIKNLIYLRYIKKENSAKRTSKWIMLRDINDVKTKYSYFNGNIALLFDDDKLRR